MSAPLPAATAVVAAAGIGTRFGAPRNKLLAPLLGRPVLRWTLEALAGSGLFQDIVMAVAERDFDDARVVAEGLAVPVRLVEGGAFRAASVRHALAAVETPLVAVHDGARPLVTRDIIARCLESAAEFGTGIAAVPVRDTLKSTGNGRTAVKTVPRDGLWAAQTPQCCRAADLRAAYDTPGWERDVTDESGLLERAGAAVRLVEGSMTNIKITTPEDLALAEGILLQRRGAPGDAPRIGYGYDIHRFASGRRMVLGGVDFGLDYGLDGHSDADALLHAVMDALLGAAGLPDIGNLFPNTDEAWRGANSMDLLAEVARRVRAEGYVVGNVDATVIAERPKIAPRTAEMKANIAGALGIPETAVGLKATTNETLGSLGAGEGLAAHAACLLMAGQRPEGSY
jgi:2-C-methyl-D-erythritol 4-phosphate cytidylyltransferase/2-C-methyl-D-erythritol 2,4-cyclodiphosphate synthase